MMKKILSVIGVAALSTLIFACHNGQLREVRQAEPEAPFAVQVRMPATFAEMAKQVIVNAAISSIQETVSTIDAGSQFFDGYVMSLRYFTTALRWSAREEFSGHDPHIGGRMYAAFMGKCHAENDGLAYQPHLANWDEGMRELAKAYLSEPANLKATYYKFRPLVRTFVQNHPMKDEFRKYVENVLLPLFAGEFDANLRGEVAKLHSGRTLLRAQYKRSEDMEVLCPSYTLSSDGHWSEIEDRTESRHCSKTALEEMRLADIEWNLSRDTVYDLERKLKANPLYYDYEWMLRRHREGGKKLIEAYLEIFQDFHDMLKT